MSDDWKAAWQPLIKMVGQDIGSTETAWGSDVVEPGAVRRYLEPLEFDCPLHYDRAAAQAHGYSDIIAPYTSLATFTMPPLWIPGPAVFDSPMRDAQPASRSLRPPLPPEAPAFSAYFATDIEIDFLRPARIGERLGRRGQRLLSCLPKETKVGRGAFFTFEMDVVTTEGEVVARYRMGGYCYNPHRKTEAETEEPV